MKTRFERLTLGLLLTASSGWATINACSGSGQLLLNFGSASPGNGCYLNDETFSNLSVTAGGALGSGTPQSAFDVDLSAGSTYLAVTTPWTVTATFTGDVPSDFQAVSPGPSGSSTGQTQGTLVYLANSQDTAANDPGAPTPKPGYGFYMNSVTLGLTGSTESSFAGDTITVTQLICAGNTACTTANSIMIAASFANNTNTPSITCSAGTSESFGTCAGAHSATANFVALQTLLSSSTHYLIIAHPETNVGPNDFVDTASTLNFISDTFGETEAAPEPSTFALLGSALAALGFVGARRAANPYATGVASLRRR